MRERQRPAFSPRLLLPAPAPRTHARTHPPTHPPTHPVPSTHVATPLPTDGVNVFKPGREYGWEFPAGLADKQFKLDNILTGTAWYCLVLLGTTGQHGLPPGGTATAACPTTGARKRSRSVPRSPPLPLNQPSFPALLLAVAATSRDGLLASYSNWGPNGAGDWGAAQHRWLAGCCAAHCCGLLRLS